ncbi:MAG: patatin family protein [Salinivirgaceae bacterium]|nr:patatin family protein [Salinivirgaceae bacterium]MDD4746989.1 patatin family protein [Salinivirgaceae bacterium]
MNNTALVLEGGGFRGMFTAGILEVFLENELSFGSVYGVSAGASYGASYISKQRERNIAVNDFIGHKRYCSINNLLRDGSLFSWEFIYETIPQKIIPFDYTALKESASMFYVGTSNCLTGEAEFFLLNDVDKKDFKTILAASGSLPLIAPIVSYNGKRLLDGGLTDSIPFEYALNNGSKRAVVILTQPKGYEKEPLKYAPVFKWFYRKYPKVYEMLYNRAERYNASIRQLEQLENEGVAYVIRPAGKLEVSRLENKPHKTAKVYETAMLLARAEFDTLQKWLIQ